LPENNTTITPNTRNNNTHAPTGALVMPLMAQGFRMGLIKFNLITATKPATQQ
jgi:hypothetical protein